jgi:hypothetical protein
MYRPATNCAAYVVSADFTYLQVKGASFPGLVEKGFRDGAAAIWPGIQQALDEHVVKGSATAVTIGGHSLGAALATLVAYQAQVRLFAVVACMMHPNEHAVR